MIPRDLDKFGGYFMVLPCDFRNPNAPQNEPYLYIREDCPADIRKEIEKTWEKVYKETKERHKNGLFTSKDYF